MEQVFLLHDRRREVRVAGRNDVDLFVGVGLGSVTDRVEDGVARLSLAVEVKHLQAGDGGQAFGALAQGDADVALSFAAVLLILGSRRPHAVAEDGRLVLDLLRRRRRDLIVEQKVVARKLGVRQKLWGFLRPRVGRLRKVERRCVVSDEVEVVEPRQRERVRLAAGQSLLESVIGLKRNKADN